MVSAVPPMSPPWTALEERLEFKIPADYKAFVEAHGAPALVDYGIETDRGLFVFSRFFVVHDGTAEDDVERASMRPSENLGTEVLAIAAGTAGDCLILIPVEDDIAVAWWHPEHEGLVEIAESFGELLQCLCPTETLS